MVKELKSWFNENQALVFFLVAQLVGFLGILGSLIAYSVKLEARVSILETRGSPHLERVDNRLTVLESKTNQNEERIARIVDKLTR
jgi:beta-lactamase regulating signal transducer with metallopeptidase domain